MLPAALSFMLVITFANQYNITNSSGAFYLEGPYNVTSLDVNGTIQSVNVTEFDLANRITTSLSPGSAVFQIGDKPFNLTADTKFIMSGYLMDFNASTPISGTLNMTLAKNNSIVAGDNCNMSMTFAMTDLNLCDDITFMLNLPPSPSPVSVALPSLDGVTSVGDSRFTRILANVAKALDGHIPFQVRFTAPSDNILRFEVTMTDHVAQNISVSFTELLNRFNKMLNDLYEFTPDATRNVIENITSRFASLNISNAPLDGMIDVAYDVPNNTKLLVDIALTDLRCDESGFTCSIPVNGGVLVDNLTIIGAESVGIVATVLQDFRPLVNMMLTKTLPFMCPQTAERCTISAPHPEVIVTPPLGLMIGLPIACVVLTALFMTLSVMRYKRKPVLSTSGETWPLHRIVVEDALFCFFVLATASMFILSNVTTAAAVVVGGELDMYVFSLRTSVEGMWHSGLRPLAALVLIFSGIYPYIKLLCMLVFTVGLQQPNSVILRSVDIIGKFSFLDTFIMLIMVAGMSVNGIGEVKMLPSFYLFLVATICSIAAGNYATHLWRRGTNVRSNASSQEEMGKAPRKSIASADGEEHANMVEPTTSDETLALQTIGAETVQHDSKAADQGGYVHRFMRRMWWRVALPSSAIILATTIPLFATTCLSFDFGGVAGTLLSKDRNFNAYSISTAVNWICAVVCICTVLVAPVISSLFYSPLVFLLSWTTADVFVLSCISGLVQSNRFIQFMLGGNYDALYSVHVHLHWPLFTLIIAALVSWTLFVMHAFNLRARLHQRFNKQRVGHESV